MSGLSAALRRITESAAFQAVTLGVILANAVLLSLQTFPQVAEQHGRTLAFLDGICLIYFFVELALRLGAFGPKPWQFFRSGWNIYDFVVVVATLVPGVRENLTLLRLARLGRVLRTVRYLPQMRIIMTAIVRSLPGALSLLAVAGLVLYLYAMLGWILFHEQFPEQYGTLGSAMVSLFCLLALDDLTNVVRPAYEYSAWTLLYYISFVLFAALVLLNILLGVVIRSMEEAHELERAAPEGGDSLLTKVDALVAAAEQLRSEVRRGGSVV